jgi:16S rRNA (cytosine967-C5)-methyltransferase
LDKRLVATVNGLLRNYLRTGKEMDPAKKFKYCDTRISIQYSFPEWLIKRWLNIWGEQETVALCQSLNERPTFDLRINRNNIKTVDFINILKEHRIHFIPSIYFEQVIKITDIQSVSRLRLFERGYCSVQDESALLALELLDAKEGDIVLDACAAPGGKYTGIMEDTHTEIMAIGMDRNYKRLKLIKANCSRLHIYPFRLVLGDAMFPPFKAQFNKILVDAPCSGLGTIQKNPDIKWRRSLDELSEFQALQLKILHSLAKMIKKNGEMVYTTCTIDPLENELVIRKFLEIQKGMFNIITPPERLSNFTSNSPFIQTFPHRDQMDGSFAVKLRKN